MKMEAMPYANKPGYRTSIVENQEWALAGRAAGESIISANEFLLRNHPLANSSSFLNLVRDAGVSSLGHYCNLVALARRKELFPQARTLSFPCSSLARHQSRGVPVLGILFDEGEEDSASTAETNGLITECAENAGLKTYIFGSSAADQLQFCDALWIRSHTVPGGHVHRLAATAEALGIPVLDSSNDIGTVADKVYMYERLRASGVPIPLTMLLPRGSDLGEVESVLGYPMVVKLPIGSFSREVKLARTRAELEQLCASGFTKSDVLVLQCFVPTDCDWRIGVINGEVLFACRYDMAPQHWQIVQYREDGTSIEGTSEIMALADLQQPVLDTAIRAAAAMGNGLYGVDLKVCGDDIFVVEVNDNADIKVGAEIKADDSIVFPKVMNWFKQRILASGQDEMCHSAPAKYLKSGTFG